MYHLHIDVGFHFLHVLSFVLLVNISCVHSIGFQPSRVIFCVVPIHTTLNFFPLPFLQSHYTLQNFFICLIYTSITFITTNRPFISAQYIYNMFHTSTSFFLILLLTHSFHNLHICLCTISLIVSLRQFFLPPPFSSPYFPSFHY